MRAILMVKENLPYIRKEVTREKYKFIRRLTKALRGTDTPSFYIPEYMFPEAKAIPSYDFVSETYLYRHFYVGAHIRDTPWISIKPKQDQQLVVLPSLEE